MSEAVKAEKLTVNKSGKAILNGLDFVVQKGSLTGLIGPSGAGKTTLMRTIMGLQRISSGRIEVLGKDAGHKMLRSKIGYVTQDSSVYADLTVRQNLDYFAKLIRADKSAVERAIAEVQLGKQINQLVSSLSGGQRARVSLAVALIGAPELLVLDEPTVGLDPLLRQDLWKIFNSLTASGKTLIISSHVMDEAERCQNVLLVRNGKLLWKDSKDGLLHAQHTDSVEEAFLKLVGEAGEER